MTAWGRKPAEGPAGRKSPAFSAHENNIGNDRDGFAFFIESVNLPSGIATSRIAWTSDVVASSADEALASPGRREGRNALDDAADWLKGALSAGPLPALTVISEAAAAGHSEKTPKRAKQALGVQSTKTASRWDWSLPTSGVAGQVGQPAGSTALGTLASLEDAEPPQQLN